MFESDQHEFDEEYEELSHATPPPPAVVKQPPAPAVTKPPASSVSSSPEVRPAAVSPVAATAVAPRTAVTGPVVVDEADEEGYDEEEPEEPGLQDEQHQEYVDPAEQQQLAVPQKKKPNLLLIGGFAALVTFALFVVYTATRPKDSDLPAGDMGPGIVAVSGLRGHLNTRWEGNAKTGRLVYQLRIEPMEDRWQPGFSQAVLNAPEPIYVNVRLLDATGFALCGKQIVFHFDPQHADLGAIPAPVVGSNGRKLTGTERNEAIRAARQAQIAQMQAAEAQRESGKDIFQNQLTNEGSVTAVNVQGTLPCAPDQFKQASYWDFNTNFPTLDQQADLLNPGAAAERARLAKGRPARKNPRQLKEGFIIQGDVRAMEYDPAKGLLWTQGKNFQIDRRTGQAAATAWANNNTLIHYRCDQHSECQLTAAGGTAVLHAWLSN
jgi:hypothetical protein